MSTSRRELLAVVAAGSLSGCSLLAGFSSNEPDTVLCEIDLLNDSGSTREMSATVRKDSERVFQDSIRVPHRQYKTFAGTPLAAGDELEVTVRSGSVAATTTFDEPGVIGTSATLQNGRIGFLVGQRDCVPRTEESTNESG